MKLQKILNTRTINRIVWLSIIAFSLSGIVFHWLPANKNSILMVNMISPLGGDFKSVSINPQSPNYSNIINNFTIQNSDSSYRLSCFHQGQLFFWQEDYSGAISILNNCSDQSQSHLKDMLLGEAYWSSGRIDEAVQNWQRVPTINSYFWQQAVVAEKNKQYKLVEEAFYKIMHVSPNWKPAIAGYWFGKSMLYLGSNEFLAGEYLHALENAIELNDDSGSRQLQLGAELYRMKEYALAQQCLINAKRLEPRSRWAYYYLGLVYFRTHKYLEAIDEFNATLEIDPDFGNAYFYAAQSFLKLEKIENAIDYLQEALRLSPNNPSYQEKMKEINLIVLEKSQ